MVITEGWKPREPEDVIMESSGERWVSQIRARYDPPQYGPEYIPHSYTRRMP